MRSKQVVLYKTKDCFVRGGERDDMIQEGMIGLFKAIRDFRAEHGCSFRSFADTCITRQMITAVKHATRVQVIRPLLLFDAVVSNRDGRDEIAWDDLLPSSRTTDMEGYYKTLLRQTIEDAQVILRGLEWNVFRKVCIEHETYEEAARALGCSVKAIDNALARIRRKLRHTQEDTT